MTKSVQLFSRPSFIARENAVTNPLLQQLFVHLMSDCLDVDAGLSMPDCKQLRIVSLECRVHLKTNGIYYLRGA